MELLFREADLGGDQGWWTPPDKGCEEAESAGIELAMVALRRDRFVLALFSGAPQPGTVHEICFGVSADMIETVCSRLQEDGIIPEHRESWLRFDDPFGFRWTLQEPQLAFTSRGEIAGRWLKV